MHSYFSINGNVLVEIPFSTKKGHNETATFLLSGPYVFPRIDNYGDWENMNEVLYRHQSKATPFPEEYRAAMLDMDTDWTATEATGAYAQLAGQEGNRHIVLRGSEVAYVGFNISDRYARNGLGVSLCSSYNCGYTDGERKFLRAAFEDGLVEACIKYKKHFATEAFIGMRNSMLEDLQKRRDYLDKAEKQIPEILGKVLAADNNLNKEDLQRLIEKS